MSLLPGRKPNSHGKRDNLNRKKAVETAVGTLRELRDVMEEEPEIGQLTKVEAAVLRFLAEKPTLFHPVGDIAAGATISNRPLSVNTVKSVLPDLEWQGWVHHREQRKGYAITAEGLDLYNKAAPQIESTLN